jgi:hypothetical protein
MSEKNKNNDDPLNADNMPRDQGKQSTAHRRENGSNETKHQAQGDEGKIIKPKSQRRQ